MSGAAGTFVTSLLLTGGTVVVTTVSGTSGRPPISWTVTFANSELNNCHSWTFTKPITSIPFFDMSAGDLGRDGAWALGQGGVDLGSGAYTVTVQGTSDQDVIIRDVRIKVLSRAPALSGITVDSPGQCGGEVSLRHYSADLDETNPRLLLDNVYGVPTVADQEYTVSSIDPEVFLLEAGLLHSSVYCTYEYQIDWSQGSKTGTVVITAPNGQPFAVNLPPAPDPSYLGENGQWVRQ